MKHLLLAICFSTLSACISAGESPLESRFSREHASLSCFEGPTSEPSCSGTGLAVYLKADEVRHLDWTIETSTRFIRRQYYFDRASPHLVIETIHAKFDAHAEPLPKPRLLSTERYLLDMTQPIMRQKEFLDHAEFLVDEFQKHRKEFTRVKTRNASP